MNGIQILETVVNKISDPDVVDTISAIGAMTALVCILGSIFCCITVFEKTPSRFRRILSIVIADSSIVWGTLVGMGFSSLIVPNDYIAEEYVYTVAISEDTTLSSIIDRFGSDCEIQNNEDGTYMIRKTVLNADND